VSAKGKILVVLAIAGIAACKKKESSAHRVDVVQADAATDKAEPLGPVRADTASVRMAIYFLPTSRVPAHAEFDRLIAAEKDVNVVAEPKPDSPLPLAYYGEPPIDEIAPPEASAMEYFSRGLSPAETAALPTSKAAAALAFSAKASDAVTQLRRAHRVAAALAAATGGVVWSEDQRIAFGADAWTDRGHALDGDTPDVEPLFVIHAYQAEKDAGVRLVSLGLGQLGLPDLVIEDATQSEGIRCTFTINLVAQLLAEGAQPDANGMLELDVGKVKNAAASKRLKDAIVNDGAGKATIQLVVGDRDDGDSDNRLWRIEFLGTTPYHERMASTLAAIFGRNDGAYGAKSGDAELAAASQKAKADFAALRPRFDKGLPDRDQLLVKAPFKTDSGGQEYMWIEVRTWKGAKIGGILTDEPFEVASLHAGAPVEVDEPDVFDFILRHPDGSVEGNYTTPILQKHEAP
jgi:uncharacterized protein YegJ (DUF2314 family)